MTPEQHEAVLEALAQVEFQLSNVQGWIGCNHFDAAAIKAEYLVKASQELHTALKEATK